MVDQVRCPTVLMVGQGEPIQGPLGEALRRHAISVACCATAELHGAVRAYAPDLVLLTGDAAVRGGSGVIRSMARSRATDVLPIAIVSNDAVQKSQLSHFRTGAVAFIARGSGADTIARRVAELTQEIPERTGQTSGRLSEDTLHEVVQLAASDAKTGILSVRAGAGERPEMSMLIESESQSAEDLDAMLNKLRDALQQEAELQYEFHEASGGRLSVVPAGALESTSDLSVLRDTRIVVLDANQLRAERLSEILLDSGVYGGAADLSLAALPRIREIDPQVIIVDATTIRSGGLDIVRAMRKDAQLQWASILVVHWEELWPARSSRPDLGKLAVRIQPLIEQDAELRRRTVDEIDFDTRFELLGPGRLIRALAAVPGVRHVTVSGTKAQVEVDIADAAVLGAYVTYTDTRREAEQGMPALMALWTLNAARVSVREQDLPSVANIMMPVDEALGMAAQMLSGRAEDGQAARANTLPPASPPMTSGGIGRTFEDPAPTTKSRVARVKPEQLAVPSASLMEASVGGQPIERRSELAEDGQEDHQEKEVSTATHPVVGADPEARTIPVGRGPIPPPRPDLAQASRTASQAKARAEKTPPESRQSDLGLARALEGGPIVAPTATKARRWMPLAAALMLLGAALMVWIRFQGAATTPTAVTEPSVEEPKGPLTGPVGGAQDARPDEPGAVTAAANEGEDPAGKVLAGAPTGPEAEPAPSERSGSRSLDIPTRNLPKDPAKASDVLVYRALPMIRKSDLVRAEATLDRAWELDPKNPQAMAGYARLFLAKEEAERALMWAKRAASRRPKRASYHVLVGDALQMNGELEAARQAWRQALRVDRRNRQARARLAATQSASEETGVDQGPEATASASTRSK